MNALEKLDGIGPIANDLLVYGCGDTCKVTEVEHDENQIALMERAWIKDIRFNLSKLRF